jgi:hypothetical protein
MMAKEKKTVIPKEPVSFNDLIRSLDKTGDPMPVCVCIEFQQKYNGNQSA